MRWDLSSLYAGFDCKEFAQDRKDLDQLLDEIATWVDENLDSVSNSRDKLEQMIDLMSRYGHLYSRLYSFSALSASENVRNDRALACIEQLQQKKAEFKELRVKFIKWLGTVTDLHTIIGSSDVLTEHEFYLIELKQEAQYLLSDEAEAIISRMQTTGSDAWTKLQEKVISTLTVDIELDGKKSVMPIGRVRNLVSHNEQSVRKAGYEAELNAYPKIADISAAALNGIKGEVITISRAKGYASPLDQTLIESRMDRETLDAMLCAIEEKLPVFHRYYRKKAQLLGHDNGLPFYDIFAPMGETNSELSFDEAKEFLCQHFASFSPDMAEFTQKAFDERWIDAEVRDGKRPGAFCSNLNSINESRVSMQYSGSLSSVMTLAHELGHAYHGYCLNSESILNCDYPMPLAETGSIFNEAIVANAVMGQADEAERFAMLERQLAGAGQVIVDIYSRYLFEAEVFARREHNSLTVSELNQIMADAQRQAYGDGLEHDNLHPYMWVCKPHYYYKDANYYNFPYAFGLLFARGLYAQYLDRGEQFVDVYNQLLSVTGKMSIRDVAASVGIDVSSKDFWRSSLQLIESDVDEFVKCG